MDAGDQMRRERLRAAWAERNQRWLAASDLSGESQRFLAEGDKVRDEHGECVFAWYGDRVRATAHRRRAERDALLAEVSGRYAEADLIWVEAVLDVCGDVAMEYTQVGDCVVEGWGVYETAVPNMTTTEDEYGDLVRVETETARTRWREAHPGVVVEHRLWADDEGQCRW
jgi:hypothetical protein